MDRDKNIERKGGESGRLPGLFHQIIKLQVGVGGLEPGSLRMVIGNWCAQLDRNHLAPCSTGLTFSILVLLIPPNKDSLLSPLSYIPSSYHLSHLEFLLTFVKLIFLFLYFVMSWLCVYDDCRKARGVLKTVRFNFFQLKMRKITCGIFNRVVSSQTIFFF